MLTDGDQRTGLAWQSHGQLSSGKTAHFFGKPGWIKTGRVFGVFTSRKRCFFRAVNNGEGLMKVMDADYGFLFRIDGSIC